MSDAFQCTKETPWSSDKGTPVEHDAVEEVGAMSLSLLKFVGQASLVDDAMLPS